MSSYVSATARAALCSAVAALLVSACADAYHSPARQVSRSAKAQVTDSPSKSVAGRQVAAARPPAKAPKPAPAPPADTLFDSRRLEGTGTLLLDDIMRLVRQAPRLADEVAAALRETNKSPQDITCIGKRIGGDWHHLAGARVQPYVCKIGTRWLQISAELYVRGARGESYSTVNSIAKENAKDIKESNPRWTWTNEKPPEWFLE